MDPQDFERLIVCWYDMRKGYGFTRSPDDEHGDVFIHKRSLEDFGLARLEPDDELMAIVSENSQGPLVQQIQSITRPHSRLSPKTATECDLGEYLYIMKFYDPAKGYGFAESTDPNLADRDIFVHARCLNDAGMRLVEPGQRVVIKPKQTERGPVADTIRLLTTN